VLDERFRTAKEIAGERRQLQAEEVANLRARDQDADPVREPDDHGARNEFDRGAEAGHAEKNQDDPGHEGAHEQPVEAVHAHDSGDDDDKRARRPTDLGAGAAQRRDDEPGDDGTVEAVLGRQARGDGERHGQGQRDESDRHPGHEIIDERSGGISPTQAVDEFREWDRRKGGHDAGATRFVRGPRRRVHRAGWAQY
jgi:hypothetical protein